MKQNVSDYIVYVIGFFYELLALYVLLLYTTHRCGKNKLSEINNNNLHNQYYLDVTVARWHQKIWIFNYGMYGMFHKLWMHI